MTKLMSRPRTFDKDLNIKTVTMKTKTTYPERAGTAKMIFVTGLILITASLTAGDGSDANQEDCKAYSAGVKVETAYHNLSEVAFETEYKIEDWMSTIYTDYLNAVANEEVIEPEIELEDWMHNIHNKFWLDLNEAEESELAIESWMTNPDKWTGSDELAINLN